MELLRGMLGKVYNKVLNEQKNSFNYFTKFHFFG